MSPLASRSRAPERGLDEGATDARNDAAGLKKKGKGERGRERGRRNGERWKRRATRRAREIEGTKREHEARGGMVTFLIRSKVSACEGSFPLSPLTILLRNHPHTVASSSRRGELRREILELLNVVISLHGEPNNFRATARAERGRDALHVAATFASPSVALWNLVE